MTNPPIATSVDVAIVGARVAGSMLARRLSEAGLSVALFDRDSLSAPTLSTHILHSTAELRAEGVYDELREMGIPPLPDVHVRIDDLAIHMHHPDDPGMCPRRDILDRVLLERAVAAGAHAYTETAVLGLLTRDDKVTGLTVAGPGGGVTEVAARLVVGADGRNSSVARWVDAGKYLVTYSERALLWRYFRGKSLPPALHWHKVGADLVSILPTGREEYLVIAQPPREEAGRLYSDPDAIPRYLKSTSPEVAELAEGGEPTGPLQRIVRYPCFFRAGFGPGWALVGDAGHAKDATLGHGINDAIRDARDLAAAILAGFADPADLDRRLSQWVRRRDRRELPNYWYGQDIGRGTAINPMEQALLRGISRHRRSIDRLDDLMADRRQAGSVLTPRRLLAAGLRRALAGDSTRTVASDVAALIRTDLRRRRAAARHDVTAPDAARIG
jgi:menaquinone-9 beta-reductase